MENAIKMPRAVISIWAGSWPLFHSTHFAPYHIDVLILNRFRVSPTRTGFGLNSFFFFLIFSQHVVSIQDTIAADATWAQKDSSYPKELTIKAENKKQMQKDNQERKQDNRDEQERQRSQCKSSLCISSLSEQQENQFSHSPLEDLLFCPTERILPNAGCLSGSPRESNLGTGFVVFS